MKTANAQALMQPHKWRMHNGTLVDPEGSLIVSVPQTEAYPFLVTPRLPRPLRTFPPFVSWRVVLRGGGMCA